MKLSFYVSTVDLTDPKDLRKAADQFEAAAKHLRAAAKSHEQLKKNPAFAALKKMEKPQGQAFDLLGLAGVFGAPKSRLSVRKAAEGFLNSQPSRSATLEQIFHAVHQMGAPIKNLTSLSALLSRERKTFKSLERGVWGLANNTKSEAPLEIIDLGPDVGDSRSTKK